MTPRSSFALLAMFGLAAVVHAGIAPLVPRIPASALKAGGDPAEAAAPATPAEIADRIAQNTKAAGDRLKDNDAGEATRKTQDQILKDIDELLKQANNPPPSSCALHHFAETLGLVQIAPDQHNHLVRQP